MTAGQVLGLCDQEGPALLDACRGKTTEEMMKRRHLRQLQLQEWLEEEGLEQVLHRMASSCVLPSWGLGLLPTRKSRASSLVPPSPVSTALLGIRYKQGYYKLAQLHDGVWLLTHLQAGPGPLLFMKSCKEGLLGENVWLLKRYDQEFRISTIPFATPWQDRGGICITSLSFVDHYVTCER